MKRILIYLVLAGLVFSKPGYGQEDESYESDSSTIQLLFTPQSYLGVRIGDELNFYQYSDSLGWKKWGDYVTLSSSDDEIIFTPATQLGERRGISLRFHTIGLFFMLEPVDSMQFLIPGGADEMILTGGYDLGVRQGRDLKFYTYMNHDWVPNPQYDYHFEEPVDEMILTSTNLLGVRTGKVLKFYNVPDQYKYVPQFDFTFETAPDEIVITGNGELGVRKGAELKLYYFDKEWKYAPQADFHIAPRVK